MGLAATIRRWRSNLAQAHEFDALGPDQREALARDMSVSCSECAVVASCRQELDREQASLTYRGDSHNAETLRELRGERPVDLSFS